MEFIPKDRLLEHHPDTLISIRKEFNLEKPGEMKEAVRILREWVKKQPHFKKKDFNDFYLETTITMSKGSLERAKSQIDRMCTMRTLLPQFFGVYNVKTDFGNLFDVVTPVMLPKLTPDHYRVFFVKINEKAYLIKDYLNYYIYNIIMSEYIRSHNYSRGFYVIGDLTETNIMDFLSGLNPVLLRQAMSIYIEAYGMRIKGLHFFTSSKLIEGFVTMLKQVISSKIGSRIHTHKSLSDLADILPLNILPEEYGGEERSLKTVFEEWSDILSSKENMEYLKDITQSGTIESLRQEDKFNEQYAGMPGTFRVLSVD